MKTIIAGTRTFKPTREIRIKIDEIHKQIHITEVVSGSARGADAFGEAWARHNHIPIKLFMPNWTEHGKAAGPLRNRAMAEYADSLIALWDGVSRGTENMIDEAKRRNLQVFIIKYV